MTLEQAQEELDEVGMTIVTYEVRNLKTGERGVAYAAVPLGQWPADTTWFAPKGDAWRGLTWYPTWEEPYANATNRSPF